MSETTSEERLSTDIEGLGMSQENVEAFKRGIDAINRGDLDALLEGLDPEVEWHPGLAVLLGGEATVYQGHEGVREFYRDLDDALDGMSIEISETRDLGDRIVAIGRFRARGKASGVETESPGGWVVDKFKNGKAARVRTYFDPNEALEAAELSE